MNEDELYDKTVSCIRCGFCLEACPTFRLTGQETESPRGRIYLVRSAIEGEIAWDDTVEHLDRCLGCRACETACPSGVEYGAILEMARQRLEPNRTFLSKLKRKAILTAVTRHLLKLAPWRRISGIPVQIPKREDSAVFPHHEGARKRGVINLLTGCVMDDLYPTSNHAARYLLERQGFGVKVLKGICCGALHKHSGLSRPEPKFPEGDIIVTSAGCGSSLKERGYPAHDLSEFLVKTGFAPPVVGTPARVVYQDACHLLHGQGIRDEPRQLLRSLPGVDLIEIGDSGDCCGSAGIYNITQPQLARQLLDKKWQAIEQARSDVVVTANPGCLAWLSQAAQDHQSPIKVVHIARFIAERCHNLQA